MAKSQVRPARRWKARPRPMSFSCHTGASYQLSSASQIWSHNAAQHSIALRLCPRLTTLPWPLQIARPRSRSALQHPYNTLYGGRL
eukprot:2544589-Pyramimonas_sp.AAC.1